MAKLNLQARLASTILAATAMFLSLPTAALATFPGRNGRIAYDYGSFTHNARNFEIHTVDARGGAARRLTDNGVYDAEPSFSPQGKHIVFAQGGGRDSSLVTMHADGSHAHKIDIRAKAFFATSPTYSEDGAQIAFAGSTGGSAGRIFVMRSNGTQLRTIFTGNTHIVDPTEPSWSPDGSRIAFAALVSGPDDETPIIVTVRPDGSHVKRLAAVSRNLEAGAPEWTPDGKSIVYWASFTGLPAQIYRISKDGRHQHRLYEDSYADFDPAVSPNGRKLAFVRTTPTFHKSSLCTIDLESSEPANCLPTRRGRFFGDPSWQAVP